MKYKQMVPKHVEEYWKISRATRDLCHKDLSKDRRRWEMSEVTIAANIGDFFPEGDMRQHYELDCCAECFLKRVKPALEQALGVEFRERRTEESDLEYAAIDAEAR